MHRVLLLSLTSYTNAVFQTAVFQTRLLCCCPSQVVARHGYWLFRLGAEAAGATGSSG
jgi:hypothetical protein